MPPPRGRRRRTRPPARRGSCARGRRRRRGCGCARSPARRRRPPSGRGRAAPVGGRRRAPGVGAPTRSVSSPVSSSSFTRLETVVRLRPVARVRSARLARPLRFSACTTRARLWNRKPSSDPVWEFMLRRPSPIRATFVKALSTIGAKRVQVRSNSGRTPWQPGLRRRRRSLGGGEAKVTVSQLLSATLSSRPRLRHGKCRAKRSVVGTDSRGVETRPPRPAERRHEGDFRWSRVTT